MRGSSRPEPADRPEADVPAGGRADPSAPAALADALLAWFHERRRGASRRDVPWRGERDPYRVWVAEVLAQQTRIETVRSYYPRFVERFPDVQALARAELDDVLAVWEGLGYYARARHLHRAARILVETRGGSLPDDPEALRELPGIGPYTAGAIASLAFGRPEPAVDGNARRVLSRLFDLAEPTGAALDRAARGLIAARPSEAAALNQALMDLGNAACTPLAPACPRCPLAAGCLSLARGTAAERPPARRSRAVPHRDVAVGIVWKGGHVLIQRRPEQGLLGGLWEFPGGKVEAGEPPRDAVLREIREELGIRVRLAGALETVDHAYSHFRVTLHPFQVRWVAGEPAPRSATAWVWTRLGDLVEYPFPAANRRIVERLEPPESVTPEPG